MRERRSDARSIASNLVLCTLYLLPTAAGDAISSRASADWAFPDDKPNIQEVIDKYPTCSDNDIKSMRLLRKCIKDINSYQDFVLAHYSKTVFAYKSSLKDNMHDLDVAFGQKKVPPDDYTRLTKHLKKEFLETDDDDGSYVFELRRYQQKCRDDVDGLQDKLAKCGDTASCDI